MGNALLRLIVVGDIPGTKVELGYRGSLVFAIVSFILIVSFLVYTQKRRVKKILHLYQYPKTIELITL